MSSRQVFAMSALIASALAVSAPAQAAVQFAGQGANNIVDGTGAFYDSAIPKGTFTDIINFDVATSGTADVGIIYLNVLSGITNLTASFNGSAINFEPLRPGSATLSGGVMSPITAGTQTLTISGLSGGKGSYSGNVAFSSAVPELATWLMMIAGVGFTGAALRRRKSDYKVNYAF
jgi:hypothetical protein